MKDLTDQELALMRRVASALRTRARRGNQLRRAAYYEGVMRTLDWLCSTFANDPITADVYEAKIKESDH